MSTIRYEDLTPDEQKWVDHMVRVNKSVTERSYVVVDPDGVKCWVCIFNKQTFLVKGHEVWVGLSQQGAWKYSGEPLPAWADPEAAPEQLLVMDGFTLEEIEQAEEIMEGL